MLVSIKAFNLSENQFYYVSMKIHSLHVLGILTDMHWCVLSHRTFQLIKMAFMQNTTSYFIKTIFVD